MMTLFATLVTTLWQGFSSPAQANRPLVWWWWQDDMSSVPQAAITRDLEGLKRVGCAGFHIYGGSATGKGWIEKAKWAFHEANRLGLDGYVMIGAAGCGHRATPHRFAPKDIVFTTVQAEGGGDIRVTLPKKGVKETPTNPDGSPELYTDIITLAAPGVPGGPDFPLESVFNVSAYLDPATDAFEWPNAPTGTWTIVRCASVPKVFGWTGCYIDHLSREALDDHWARVVTPLLAALAPDERAAFKGVMCDSWEAGTTSWTEKFPEEFKRLHGYSVYPWLVHKAGLGPGDRASRAKFRRDWDETIASLIAENHYACQRELAHREGLVSVAEACGPHQRQGDVRRMQGRCDVAMGEFWMPSNHRPEDTQRFMVRDAATAAHVYGIPEVLAEAFTTINTYWTESPRTLKPCADRAFCDGLTRICYHGMKLSGSLIDRPGAIRNVGTHYNPQTTWFEQSAAFNLYLARCSWMLSQGRFAADVLVYAGDAINVFAGMKDPRDALGPGFDYDFCPTELLLAAKVDNGEIVLPSGMRYRALVIADKNPAANRMAPGRLPPVQATPPWTPSIPAEAQTALARLEASGAAVLRTRTARAAWTARQVRDFATEGLTDETSVDWIHRTGDFGDLYFIANRAETRQVFTARLRATATAVELWDPVTGERRRAIARPVGEGVTEVKVDLPAFGSVFVVFANEATAEKARTPNPVVARKVPGDWTVTFDRASGGPAEPVDFPELEDWTVRPEEAIRHYSGTATYRRTVAFDPSAVRDGSRVVLDLGMVHEVAEVEVNGRACGTVWTAPYRVDITEAVATNLELVVRVTNLWPNRLIGDAALPEKSRVTRTNLNTYKANDPLLPSGLIGPMTIRTESRGAWRTRGNGVMFDGAELTVRRKADEKELLVAATFDLDLSQGIAPGFNASVDVSAASVARPAQPYLGYKFMLHYRTPGAGMEAWPGARSLAGTVPWCASSFGRTDDVLPSKAELVLGLQETSGEMRFDLSSLEIRPRPVFGPVVNRDHVAVYTPDVISRGPRRGVMSPGSRPMTMDDFDTLERWGVTLLRYQMNRNWNAVNACQDLDEYDRWLAGKLDHLDKVVLPACVARGIDVVIDLHMPPGGSDATKDMNMFHDRRFADHFLACWERIAKRFAGRKGIYGFDLVNEPRQTREALAGCDYWTLQRRAAEIVRRYDPTTPILVESNDADAPAAFAALSPFALTNVIYQVHMYIPGEYTHQRIYDRKGQTLTYPDATRGWNRDFVERCLEEVRKFQLRHGAKIYLGEFSAVAWAPGAENYLRDVISVAEAYGWDWSYHSFREWGGWSVEHEGPDVDHLRRVKETPRMRALLEGFKRE